MMPRRAVWVALLGVALLLGLSLDVSISQQTTSLQQLLQILDGANRNLKDAETQTEMGLIPTLSGLLPHLSWKVSLELPPADTLQQVNQPLPSEILDQLLALGVEPKDLREEAQRDENKLFVLLRQEPAQPPLGVGLNPWSGRLEGALCSSDITQSLGFVVITLCHATPPGTYKKLYDVFKLVDSTRERVAQFWLEIEIKGTIATPPGGQPPGEQPPPSPGEVTLTVRSKKTTGDFFNGAPIKWTAKREDGMFLGQGTTATTFQLNVPKSARVTLEALNTGSLQFKQWEGFSLGVNPIEVTVSANATATAIYEETIPTGPSTVTLTVKAWQFSEAFGFQPISVQISGNPSSCSGTTTYQCQVNKDSNVTLTAPTSVFSGFTLLVFAHWRQGADPPGGTIVSSANTVSVQMNASKTMHAVYIHAPGGAPPGSVWLSQMTSAAKVLRGALAAAARPTPQDAVQQTQAIIGRLDQALSGLNEALGTSGLPEAARPHLSASAAATEQARGSLSQIQTLLQQEIQTHGGESVSLEAQQQALTFAAQAANQLTVAIREKESGETTVRESFATKIFGFKFEDLNGNGQWEGQPGVTFPPGVPTNEPPIEGWEITLHGPEGEKETKTDERGRFEFVVRTPGTYTITEEQRNGWLATTESTKELMVRVFPGETLLPVLFGNGRPDIVAELLRVQVLDSRGLDPHKYTSGEQDIRMQLHGRITNRSPYDVPQDFRVVFQVDDQSLLPPLVVTGLAARASRELSISWSASEGRHRLALVADIDNTVSESNEENNVKQADCGSQNILQTAKIKITDGLISTPTPNDPPLIRSKLSVDSDPEEFAIATGEGPFCPHAVRHEWDFGDQAQKAVGETANHEYKQDGEFTITLTTTLGSQVVVDTQRVRATNKPVIQSVEACFNDGVGNPQVFIVGVPLPNPFTATIEWNGNQSDKVIFELDSQPPPQSVPSSGNPPKVTSPPFDMGTLRPWPGVNTLRVIAAAKDAQGQEVRSEPFILNPKSVPIPLWLLQLLGGNPLKVQLPKAGCGPVTYEASFEFPNPKIKGEFTVPDFVPIFNGKVEYKAGAEFKLTLKSTGEGSGGLKGEAGLTKETGELTFGIKGDAEGTATLKLDAIQLIKGNFQAGLEGSVGKEWKISDLFPALKGLENIPLVGKAIGWVINRVTLTTSLAPRLEGDATYTEGNTCLGIVKCEGLYSGLIKLLASLKAELAIVEVEAFAGATPKVTYKAPGSDGSFANFEKAHIEGQLGLKLKVTVTLIFSYEWGKTLGVKFICAIPGGCPPPEFLDPFEIVPRPYVGPGFQQFAGVLGMPNRFGTQEFLHMKNVFPAAEPKLIANDKLSLAVWVTDDLSKPVPQGTELVYSLAPAGTLDFGAPLALTSNSKPEGQPTLAFDAAGKAILVWTQHKDPNIAENAPFNATLISGLEIVYSVFEPNTRTWSVPQTITSNDVVDHSPKLVRSPSGKLVVVWAQNKANELFPDSSNPDTLLISEWDGNAFGAPQLLRDNDVAVMRAFTHYGDGRVLYVWTEDLDGNFETTADEELFSAIWQAGSLSALLRITDNDTDDERPALVITPDGTALLIWTRRETNGSGGISYRLLQSHFDGTSWSAEETIEAGTRVADFKLAQDHSSGDLVLVSVEMTPEGADIFHRVFDFKQRLWSGASPTTEDLGLEEQLHPIILNGVLLMSYLKQNIELDPQGVPVPKAQDLYVLRQPLAADLVVEDVKLSNPNPAPGETVTMQAVIQNKGTMTAEGVEVEFRDETVRKVIKRETISMLKPGERTEVSVEWTLSLELLSRELSVTIDPTEQIPDRSRANNHATLSTTTPDLVVEELAVIYPQGSQVLGPREVLLRATIANRGVLSAPGGAVVAFTASLFGKTEERSLIAEHSLETLEVNASTQVEIVWDVSELEAGWYTVTATVDEAGIIQEVDRSNNQRDALTKVLPDLALDAFDVKIQEGSTVEIDFFNLGVVDAKDVKVGIFRVASDGGPGELLLMLSQDVIPAGEMARLQAELPEIPEQLFVLLDPEDRIAELSETNNVVLKLIEIPVAQTLTASQAPAVAWSAVFAWLGMVAIGWLRTLRFP